MSKVNITEFLQEIGTWDCKGDALKDAYDQCCGDGAWDAIARRIVACVNRLAQFTTEQLEDPGIDLFADERRRLEAMNYRALMAIRDAKMSARRMITDEGHEVVCLEPQRWREMCDATRSDMLTKAECERRRAIAKGGA